VKLCQFCGRDHSIIGVDASGRAWCFFCEQEAPAIQHIKVSDENMKKAAQEVLAVKEKMYAKKINKEKEV